jgi:hypothetical protein
MKDGRENFTATLLKNGQVLAVGGFNNCDDDFCSDINTAELYNPATGTWTQTGSLQGAREQHTATLLRGGDVLVAGGLNEGGFCCSQFEYSSAELYDPATGTWSPTASMAAKHAGQTATPLPNGWVVVAGGGTSVAEIYEPGRGLWVAPGALNTARTHQTATLLPSGRVLVAGGDGPDGQPLSTAEEFLTGKGPLVTVTPGSIAFGGQLVGTASAAHFYKVTNAGTANLVIAGATVSGKNPGDFRAHTGCAAAPVQLRRDERHVHRDRLIRGGSVRPAETAASLSGLASNWIAVIRPSETVSVSAATVRPSHVISVPGLPLISAASSAMSEMSTPM